MKKLLCISVSLALATTCFADPFRIVASAVNPEIDNGPIFGPIFKGGVEKSKQLPELYEAVAKMGGAEFLDAGSVVSTAESTVCI